MEAMQFSRHIQAKNKATHKSTIEAYARRKYYFWVHKTTVSQPTRLTSQQIDEIR
jgi:SPX domain protein involved in polyphosphate accumulation